MKSIPSLLLITAALLYSLPALPQESLTAGLIAFYNIENLFDTINTPGVDDIEFLPDAAKKWNSGKYYHKLGNLARVIAGIGRDEGLPGGPHILGLCEIENREVMEDLVNQDLLRHLNYSVVHYNSLDSRGVDVGLIYRPEYFVLTASKSYDLLLTPKHGEEYYTRSQLVVSGLFMGEKMHFIVNHWPSRRGGSKISEKYRIAAAQLTRSIVDSLVAGDPEARIMVMGDLNDDPRDVSITRHLLANGRITKLKEGELFNPMDDLFRKGVGSLAYRDKWNLFDQIIISQPFLGDDPSRFRFHSARVYRKDFMTQSDGRYRGYPLRTYVGDQFMGGYSDHFPVYVMLIRQEQ